MKILHFHGLGDGVEGPQVQSLKDVFGDQNVDCPDMNPFIQTYATDSILNKTKMKKKLEKCIDSCVSVQSRRIEEFQPHVIVACSWGGVIAVECVLRGIWNGPLILISCAFRHACNVKGLTNDEISELETSFAKNMRSPTVIIHGSEDRIIPIGHSTSLEISLRRNTKPVKCYVCQGKPHVISRYLVHETNLLVLFIIGLSIGLYE